MMMVRSHSIVDCDFTVASSTAVMYDWGEQDVSIHGIMTDIFMLFFQH